MNKYNDKSKGKQVFAAQQMRNASHPGPVTAAMLTQEGIAKHAYEIYVEMVASVPIAGSCSHRQNPREIVLMSNFDHLGSQSARNVRNHGWRA